MMDTHLELFVDRINTMREFDLKSLLRILWLQYHECSLKGWDGITTFREVFYKIQCVQYRLKTMNNTNKTNKLEHYETTYYTHTQ